MEADELAAIRAARVDQLKQGGISDINGSDGPDPDAARQQQDVEAARRDMLATIVDSTARERLSRIALVNPSLSSQIEGILLRMAQSGQIRARVTDEQLLGLLDQAEAQGKSSQKKGGVVFARRKPVFDDDDFDF